MEQLLRVREAAELLALPKSTVYYLVKRGILKAVKLPSPTHPEGWIIRIRESVLEQFLREAEAAGEQT